MLGLRDICEKVADKYGEDADYIEFVMKDVFYGIKQIARTKLFVNFWKGISLSPWISIVVSPKYLLHHSYFEKYFWYQKKKQEYYKGKKKSNYKGFTFENFEYLKERLIKWLDENNIQGEEREIYLKQAKE